MLDLESYNLHSHQAVNLDVFGFALDEGAMAQLDGCEEGLVTGWDPVAHDPV